MPRTLSQRGSAAMPAPSRRGGADLFVVTVLWGLCCTCSTGSGPECQPKDRARGLVLDVFLRDSWCAAQLAARAESRRAVPPVLGDELRRAADLRGVSVVRYVSTCCGRGACRELCERQRFVASFGPRACSFEPRERAFEVLPNRCAFLILEGWGIFASALPCACPKVTARLLRGGPRPDAGATVAPAPRAPAGSVFAANARLH